MKPHLWFWDGLWHCDPYRFDYRSLTKEQWSAPCTCGETPKMAFDRMVEVAQYKGDGK